QDPARDRPEHRPKHCRPAEAVEGRALRNWTRNSLELQSAILTDCDHAIEARRRRPMRLEPRDQPVARALEVLLRLIVHDLVVDRIDIGLAHRDTRRKRDGDAQLAARKLVVSRRGQRLRKGLAPLVELSAVRGSASHWKIERKLTLLGHADL